MHGDLTVRRCVMLFGDDWRAAYNFTAIILWGAAPFVDSTWPSDVTDYTYMRYLHTLPDGVTFTHESEEA